MSEPTRPEQSPELTEQDLDAVSGGKRLPYVDPIVCPLPEPVIDPIICPLPEPSIDLLA